MQSREEGEQFMLLPKSSFQHFYFRMKKNIFIILFLALMNMLSTSATVNNQVLFGNQLINHHFGNCGVMKIKKEGSEEFSSNELKVPLTLIDFRNGGHQTVLDYFNQTLHHSLVARHNQHCFVYMFSLNGFAEEDLHGVYEVFRIKAFEVQATFSHLIIAEFEDFTFAENFVLSKELKIYQHRIMLVSEQDSVSITVKRFCYFCQHGGNPGFLQDLTLQESLLEFQTVSELFPDVTINFNGKTVRITGPTAPPLVLITPSKTKPGQNEIQGQQANIVMSIAHHFNFTPSLHSSPGGSTGIKLPNGTWTGIMGEILYDTADVGISVATSHERYKIVDATVSVFYAFLVLVSTKPKPIFEWQAIFYPFKKTAWMAFIVSTFFTFFVSKWLHNNAIRYEIPAAMKGIASPKEILSKIKKEFMTNYKSFYITVGQLLEQGTPFDFNAIPSRMYVIFWMFFAMIITTAYRSKLFTFLTFPHVEVPPSTFLELSRSTYKWGMKHLGGIAFVFITKSPLQYIRDVGEKMAVYNDKYSCLDRTFKDRFTCIIYKAYIDYVAEIRYWKVRHQLYVSDFVTPPVGSSWVLPKNAPWLPAFDKVSSLIFEMNLAERYLNDYQVQVAKVLREKVKASNSTEDKFDINDNFKGDDDEGPKPLVMANLYAAFFILLFGLILGGIILALEIMKRNKAKKKFRRKQQRLKIHLRRKVKQQKRLLPMGASRLSFQTVVRVIMPNSNDVVELSREYPLT